MDRLIDWVLGMVMGAIAAALLFMLFFGSGNAKTILFGGTSATHTAGDTFTGDANADTAFGRNIVDWEGVWYWMCSAMEYPIAKYYYDYCYVPEVLGDYYIDEALGVDYTYENLGAIDAYNLTTDNKLNIKRVPTDLENEDIVVNSSVEYTTGWY